MANQDTFFYLSVQLTLCKDLYSFLLYAIGRSSSAGILISMDTVIDWTQAQLKWW